MQKTYSDLPEWTFSGDEVSAGVYEVIATDSTGHKVSIKGTDFDEMVARYKAEASKISAVVLVKEERNLPPS